MSKTKNLKRSNFGQYVFFERRMRFAAKLVDQSLSFPHMFSKRKDSGFPYDCADAAAVDGRLGSNAYEVNPWLWQFGRGQAPP